MSHHSSDPEQQKELHQTMKELMGEYPNGRLNAKDEGAVAVAISNEKGVVTMQFPKNLNWIGFTPEQAIDIAQTLVQHARRCGCSKPLQLHIG